MEQVQVMPAGSISNEQLFAKLCEVEKLLTQQQQEDKRGLWGVKDIAAYVGFTVVHICRSIVSDPRFPAPVDLQGRRMWLRKEVIAFFERHKVKKARV